MVYFRGVSHPEVIAKVKAAVGHCELRDVEISNLESFRKEFQAVCHLVESCSESDAAIVGRELEWVARRLKKLQESWGSAQLELLEIAREPAKDFFRHFEALIGQSERETLLEVFREFLKLNKDKQFGSLAANKEAASAINNAMNQLGVRAKFTFRGKQVAAGYRCARFENSPNGQFYFEFSIDGKQEQQGHRAVLHDIDLVAPSPRKHRPRRS